MTGHRDAAELASVLGVPVERNLLELALTHRSFSYENGEVPHNERLEFLGDSVVGLAVTDRLYAEFPHLPEGELAKHRASLVSTVALAEAAALIDLGSFVQLGRGEELTGGREKASILADTFEAVIGAVYLSAGHQVATELVLRLLKPLFDDPDRVGAALDPKTALQELAVERGLGAPEYEVSGTGPDHARVFTAVVSVGGAEARGEGSSKKQAEMAAALELATQLSRTPSGA